MNYNFGSIIKSLRKQKNLTQEHIAEALGVSCQAISKWETNCFYPDISLLPIIADYFDVSIDYLLCHDTGRQKEEIEKICQRADELFEKKNYAQAVLELREMLIKHPGNEQLMYKLAWALSGTKQESEDNYEEAILIYLKILEISSDAQLKIKVTRDLIYRYATKGDIEKALYYANSLPSFEFCKEYNLGRANLLKGRELSEYLQSNIQLFVKVLIECLEYFELENILTYDEKKPYTIESAKKKINVLKSMLG